MKLLIVDDEILAIQGLLDDIPWESLQFDQVLTANSYAQAVNLFMSHEIDVLLCDIEMPFGSGLDLVRWVKEHYKHTQSVFLTCHDDFSFAKQAIDLQCIGYLLKPVDTEDVVESLKKARENVLEKDKSQMYHNYGKIYLDHLREDSKGHGTKESLQQVTEYIHSHISEPLNVEKLAGMVCMSAMHLGRLFKKKYNLTVIDYITKQRIHLAKEFLRDEDLTISAIAAKCGYNNYSYFTKTFKKHTGKTPREYQQECLKHNKP